MKLSFAIELLRQHHGDKLLRLKGIANVAGEPLPFVVHGVQHIFYPPTTLEAWPSDDRRSRFVFITKDLNEDTVRSVLDGLFAPASGATAPAVDVAR
jgi:G3E family GTPase